MVRVIDRTGFGWSWRENTLTNALVKLHEGSGDRIGFIVDSGSKLTCSGGTTCKPHIHGTPLGALTLVRRTEFLSGADTVSCDDPQFPETWKVEPYCAGDYAHHVAKGIVAFNCQSPCLKGHTLHELAHAFGLADTYIFPGCGVGGTDIMCQLSAYYFNAHSQFVFDANYGHTP